MITLALLAFCLAAPAGGQERDLPILEDSHLMWNGYCRLPAWITYRLQYRTPGETFEGRICIEAGNRFSAEVTIPASSQKEVEIPVLIRDGTPAPISCLEDLPGKEYQGSNRSLPQPVPLKPGEILIGIITDGPGTEWLDASRYLEQAKTLVIPTAGLPTLVEEYDPFDILLLPDAPDLSAEKKRAIWTWMLGGGILFLPGPQSFHGDSRDHYFQWLFPEVTPGGGADPVLVLHRWGVYDFETVFLDTLGINPRRTATSPLGSGRIVLQRIGDGGLVFLTVPLLVGGRVSGSETDLQAFWRVLVSEVLQFETRSPPNPNRSIRKISLVEPRLYRFFEAARWPKDTLRTTEIALWAYAGLATLVILFSLVFMIRKRIHFLGAAGVCLIGSVVILLFLVPRKAAVGETLDLISLENGKLLANHRKILHIASFAPSTVDCSFSGKDWFIQPVGFSQEDLQRIQPHWAFKMKGHEREMGIHRIQLPEGGRFLTMVTKNRSDFGRFTARWISPELLELKNEIKAPVKPCIIIRKGEVLPLGGFTFGDPPRRIDLREGWESWGAYLEKLAETDPVLARRIRIFIANFYREGERLLAGTLVRKGKGFQSDDMVQESVENPLIFMVLPPPEK
jgi:hypothetical protein